MKNEIYKLTRILLAGERERVSPWIILSDGTPTKSQTISIFPELGFPVTFKKERKELGTEGVSVTYSFSHGPIPTKAYLTWFSIIVFFFYLYNHFNLT